MGIKQNVFYRLENEMVHQLEVPHKIYLCLSVYTFLVPLSIYPSVNIRRSNLNMDFFFQSERNWNIGVGNIKGKIYGFKFEDKTDPLPPAQREIPSMNTSFVNKKKKVLLRQEFLCVPQGEKSGAPLQTRPLPPAPRTIPTSFSSTVTSSGVEIRLCYLLLW